MASRMLRGRAPLTFVRGAAGVGQHVYFSQLVDPAAVDKDEQARLVDEHFLEWVVPDGDGWKLAEDTVSGGKGDAVTVGSTAIADPDGPETDPGDTNVDASKAKADAEVADKRAAAKAKLPSDGSAPHGNASKDVWVEYLAGRGYDYDELVKQDKSDLVELAK
jgi:hypothetical protein